jgi:hypothetical protein
MFTATFAMDTYRWADQGLDWSDEGRRYAPWPLKSAGAVKMTNHEQEMTMIIAAGLSGTIALADFFIVQIKRYKARKLALSLPVGTPIISKRPWPEADPEAEVDDKGKTGDEAGETPSFESPSLQFPGGETAPILP